MKKLFPAFLMLAVAFHLAAEVKMPSIFSDNMVLQQGVPLPVWGKASPGENVTVTFGGRSTETTADASGKWRVVLPAEKMSRKAAEMKIAGNNTVIIKNILVGDVWLASGQSNMGFALREADNAGEAIARANYPEIRYFLVKQNPQFEPQDDCPGAWLVLSPENAGKMSAVAFFFAEDLYRTFRQPLGVICSYWGGTNAKAWMPREIIEANFPHYIRELEKHIENIPSYTKRYNEKLLPEYNAYLEARKKDPKVPWMRKPDAPGASPRVATCLFNGMIHPLVPYAVNGVIWYQGEANAGAPLEYEKLMTALISDWRKRFGRDFPFYFVQLASFYPKSEQPTTGNNWAYLREAQTANRNKIPNTGMALAIDVGDAENIHPRDKMTVGRRLALLEKKRMGLDVECQGPVFNKMTVLKDKAVLSFTNCKRLETRYGGKKVPGFAVAGADGKFFWADAVIDEDTVIVSSPEVKDPVAVRYAWENNPETDLYNEAGLPAEPFRTDKRNPEGLR